MNADGRTDLAPDHIWDLARETLNIPDASLRKPGCTVVKIPDLLRFLAGHLHKEAESMEFDYLQMHILSWEILNQLSDSMRMVSSDATGLRDDKKSFMVIVLDFFRKVRGTARLPDSGRDLLLDMVASVLDAMLSEKGGLVTAKQTLLIERRKRSELRY